jgi:hypothetical protein
MESRNNVASGRRGENNVRGREDPEDGDEDGFGEDADNDEE